MNPSPLKGVAPDIFSRGKRLPVVLQTEAAECGLACLAMVASYYDFLVDLSQLRQRFSVSMKGMSLANIIEISGKIGLAARPVKAELESLRHLRLPCILHWNFNHFVVLKGVKSDSVVIVDPAFGERICSSSELSRSFTGVALELWPGTDFRPQKKVESYRFSALIGHLNGLRLFLSQILLLAISLEIMAVASPLFLQWTVDNVLVAADRDLLTTLAIGFGLLLIMQQVISAGRSWALAMMGATINLQWRGNVFSHLLKLPIQYFEKRHLGDVISRFGSIDQIQRTLTTSALEVMLDGFMSILTLIMMLIYSRPLAAVVICTMALYALARWYWYAPLKSVSAEHIIHAAKQQSHLLETVRGIKTIKLFQRQDIRRSSWLAIFSEQINSDIQSQKIQLLYKSITGILIALETILVIWIGAGLVLDGTFSVGALLAFNSYRLQFDARMTNFIEKVVDLRMLRLYGDRLSDIVFTGPESSLSHFDDDSIVEPSIGVRKLRFRYGDQEEWILNGVDLDIAAGESVAIVGASGCGKTTLINVLLGVLGPYEGEIFFGGKDRKNIGDENIRKMFGTVLQDDVLFAGSIFDNISFFDPSPDKKFARDCAAMAGIADDIERMPMRYNTLVGDMGTVLSGGQKQRVLLARALYKKPKILFLDEATSHLDARKENEVNEAIKNLKVTRIIIAHRQETIASADRVVTLSMGKVVDETRNDQLHKIPFGEAA
ncbi:peptidase domain-containing ABC transporter [Xylophilus sp. GW821-FHT01B05]